MPEQWQIEESLRQGIEAKRTRIKNVAQAIHQEIAGDTHLTEGLKADNPIIQKVALLASQQFVLIEELLLKSDIRQGQILELDELRTIRQERHATVLMESDPEIAALNPHAMAQHISLMPPEVILKCFSAECLPRDKRLIILRALGDLREWVEAKK